MILCFLNRVTLHSHNSSTVEEKKDFSVVSFRFRDLRRGARQTEACSGSSGAASRRRMIQMEDEDAGAGHQDDLFEAHVLKPRKRLMSVCALCRCAMPYEDEVLHVCCTSVCSACRADAYEKPFGILCVDEFSYVDVEPEPMPGDPLDLLPQLSPDDLSRGDTPRRRRQDPISSICFYCCGEDDVGYA